MNEFYKTGIEIFRNGFDNVKLLDKISENLSQIKSLDLFNSTEKYPINEDVSNQFISNDIIKSIIEVLCPSGYKKMAEWFLNKKSFLPTHRDAVFFPYHQKNIKENIKYKICNGELFSRIYFNIMVFLTDEYEGYEYYYVPKTHILDEKEYKKYFTYGVTYKDNFPIFKSVDDTNDILSNTGCTEEEYRLYNSLVPENLKNLIFPKIRKGDIIIQSGSLIHGSLGEVGQNSLNKYYRKSYILRICSNEYFNL